MKKTQTARALTLNVLSVLLCVAMLAGSTFAWFTDTAVTGVNTVTSGNLDVKVSYYNGGEWQEVSPGAKLFDDNALWEPGHTEVAYIKVENKGSLALKYRLSVNVADEIKGKNADGGEIILSQILKFDAIEIEPDKLYSSRGEAIAAVEATAGVLKTKTFTDRLAALAPAKYYALVVYMPETVGNEANHDGTNVPSVKLGVNLAATQDTLEEDSFGELYDEYSEYPILPYAIDATVTNVTNVKAGEPVSGGDVVVQSAEYPGILARVPAENYSADEDNSYTTTLNVKLIDWDSGSSTYNIDVSITDQNGANVALSTPVKVEVELSAGLADVKVYHEGTPMTESNSVSFTADQQFYYNASTGLLTVYSQSFSKFKVSYKADYSATVNGVGYRSFAAAFNASKAGDTIVIYKDAQVSSTIPVAKNLTIDLNGHTLKSTAVTSSGAKTYPFVVYEGYDLTVKNGRIETVYAAINQGNVTFENAHLVTSFTQAISPRGGVLTIDKNSSVTVTNTAASAVAISVIGDGDQNGANPTVNVYGKINCAGAYAIAGNGNARYWGTTVNIYEGAEISAGLCGIFNPQDGTVNIYGGSITALRSAIEMRGGKLNIYGGELAATSDTFGFVSNNSGITATGVALAVSQHNTQQPIKVEIWGGKLSGLYALYEDDTYTDTEKSKGVEITVFEGIFNGQVLSVNNKLTDKRN